MPRHVLAGPRRARHDGAGGVGVVPKAGLGALLLQLGDLGATIVDVQVALDLVERVPSASMSALCET